METVVLPGGTPYVKFSVITHLFATAMCVPTEAEGALPGYAAAHATVDTRLSRAVELGDLRVRDPLTLMPHHYPVGNALREAVVSVDDLRQYAARCGLPPIAATPVQPLRN